MHHTSATILCAALNLLPKLLSLETPFRRRHRGTVPSRPVAPGLFALWDQSDRVIFVRVSGKSSKLHLELHIYSQDLLLYLLLSVCLSALFTSVPARYFLGFNFPPPPPPPPTPPPPPPLFQRSN
jgi:hypothetical protein